MRRRSVIALAVATLAVAATGELVDAPRARAGIGSDACGLLGKIGEGWWGSACDAVLSVGGKAASAGKKALKVLGKLGSNPLLQRAAGIAGIVAWVLGGAKWTMSHLAGVIAHTTEPTLTASWFTGVYLRVEGLALFFTLLFICAAAAEAVLRSEAVGMARAILLYLPLAALLTAVAAPLTMLLLTATDQLSAGLEALAGQGATSFLTGTSAWVVAGLTLADPFFAVMAGGLVVAAAGALWLEMLIREVAVYVVVAMLPVVFAAMVWPARRVWAVRAVEVLIALILAKVAIVAVLALGGAALAHAGVSGLTRLLAGLALVILGAFSPWLLLRLIPIAELASTAVGHVRGHLHASTSLKTPEAALAGKAAEHFHSTANGQGRAASDGFLVHELLDQMHRRAQSAENGRDVSDRGATAQGTAVVPDGGGPPMPTAGSAAGATATPPEVDRRVSPASDEPPSRTSAGQARGATDRSPTDPRSETPATDEVPPQDSAPPLPPPDPHDGPLSPDEERHPNEEGS